MGNCPYRTMLRVSGQYLLNEGESFLISYNVIQHKTHFKRTTDYPQLPGFASFE